MSLLLLFGVVKHHNWGIEIDNLSRGQQVKVGAAVAPTVTIPNARLRNKVIADVEHLKFCLQKSFQSSCLLTNLAFNQWVQCLVTTIYRLCLVSDWRIHPLKFEFAIRHRHLVVERVALLLGIWDVHGDRTTSEEHPHIAILWIKDKGANRVIQFFILV